MKAVILTEEEQKLLEEVENGEWVPVIDKDKAKKNALAIAKNTLNKTKNINIRLSEKDIQKAKIKAVEAGIPYQTLISSVIHRFVNE
jgi:predicted DNA binding CopG/RHH family protein